MNTASASPSPDPRDSSVFSPEVVWGAALRRVEHTEHIIVALVSTVIVAASILLGANAAGGGNLANGIPSKIYWPTVIVLMLLGFAHLHLINLLMTSGRVVIEIEREFQGHVDCFRKLVRRMGERHRKVPAFVVGFAAQAFAPSAIAAVLAFCFAHTAPAAPLAYGLAIFYSVSVFFIYKALLAEIKNQDELCRDA